MRISSVPLLFVASFAVGIPTALGFRSYNFGLVRALSGKRAQSPIRKQSGRTMMSESNPTKRITAEDVLKNPKWPATWPYSAVDFSRADESEDEFFYDSPRLVYHIDDKAVAALTGYYEKNIPAKSNILDICSSWVSHYPQDFPSKMGKRVGLGMNKFELAKNTQLSEYVVQNLNKNPSFPFPDNSFDIVTCVVSIDYLNKPLEIFKEVRRVLKPGGRFIVSQSNRCFPTKAIQIWLNTNDMEHIFIIGSYFHYAGGFKPAEAFDVSPSRGSIFGSDPMYIIQAEKA